jgi:hypothetical protein
VGKDLLKVLDTISYVSMVIALGVGALIILGAIFKGIKAEKAAGKAASEEEAYKKVEASQR